MLSGKIRLPPELGLEGFFEASSRSVPVARGNAAKLFFLPCGKGTVNPPAGPRFMALLLAGAAARPAGLS